MESKNADRFNFYVLMFTIIACMVGLGFSYVQHTTMTNSIKSGAFACTESMCTITSPEVMSIIAHSGMQTVIGFIALMVVAISVLFAPGLIKKDTTGYVTLVLAMSVLVLIGA